MEQTLYRRMKRYALIVNETIIGIFFVRKCAEIYANGLSNAKIKELNL